MIHACIASYRSFFFNDTPTTEIYTLSLHDALPILGVHSYAATSATVRRPTIARPSSNVDARTVVPTAPVPAVIAIVSLSKIGRAQSELQSPDHLVCRLLLEKKNNKAALLYVMFV